MQNQGRSSGAALSYVYCCLHVNTWYTGFVNTRNVTLALPDQLVRRIKIIAAQRDTSISALLASQLQLLVDQEDGYDEALRELMSDLRRGYDLGTGGQLRIDRDSLHERR